MAKKKRNEEMIRFHNLLDFYELDGKHKKIIWDLVNEGLADDLGIWENRLDVSTDCARELYEQYQRVKASREVA